MLSGELPFDAEAPGDVIIRIATEDPPDLLTLQPDLPERLVDVVRRAMQREPDDRYPSASAMQAALIDLLASPDEPEREEPTAPWSPRSAPPEALARDRSLGLRGGVVALVTGGLIALGLALWASSDVDVPTASEPPADPDPPRALLVEPVDTLARVPVPRREEPTTSEEPPPAVPESRATRPALPPRVPPAPRPPPPRAEGLLRDPGF
jgi:serine/threonine-protein kinase